MEHSLYVDEARMEPLQLGVLAGLTPPHVECRACTTTASEPRSRYDGPDGPRRHHRRDLHRPTAYEIADGVPEARRPRDHGRLPAHPRPRRMRASTRTRSSWATRSRSGRTVVEDAGRGKLQPVYRAPPGIAQPGGAEAAARPVTRARATCRSACCSSGRGCRFVCDFCAIDALLRHAALRAGDRRTILDEIETQDRKTACSSWTTTSSPITRRPSAFSGVDPAPGSAGYRRRRST